MADAIMEVIQRDDTGKGAARKLRQAGKVPGVLYGEGEPPRAILLDAVQFETLRRTGAHVRLLDVHFAEGKQSFKALVREMQIHPVSRAVLHVDLQRVSMTKRVRVTVPIVLLGKPEGVKTQGGILEHHLRDVEVECLPTDIPENITLDVSNMLVGQAIHISDLGRPDLHFLGHPGSTVATVSLPAAERAAEVPAEGAVLAAGEVAEGAEGDKEKDKEADKDKPKEKEKPAGKERDKGSS